MNDQPTTEKATEFPFRYLGEPVQIVEDLGNGWVITEWQDGRRWRQWKAQIHPV